MENTFYLYVEFIKSGVSSVNPFRSLGAFLPFYRGRLFLCAVLFLDAGLLRRYLALNAVFFSKEVVPNGFEGRRLMKRRRQRKGRRPRKEGVKGKDGVQGKYRKRKDVDRKNAVKEGRQELERLRTV
jgi:hypothetical protein